MIKGYPALLKARTIAFAWIEQGRTGLPDWYSVNPVRTKRNCQVHVIKPRKIHLISRPRMCYAGISRDDV